MHSSRSIYRLTCAALGATTALALSGCGGSPTDEKTGPTVVASTNVWGSVSAAIAGADADVESIIKDPSADPHSFESSPSDIAALTDADLVVYNGDNYDPFVDKVLPQRTGKAVVEAFESAPDGDRNEHVWYDTDAVRAIAGRIAAALGKLDPGHARNYTARADAFASKLGEIAAITAKVAATSPNAPVAQTEPVAHYLLRACGSVDATPTEFEDAVENGTDPSPAAVAATGDLIEQKKVRALIYNAQTEDKTTRQLRDKAEAAGVPVVDVTETLPAGLDYLQWQLKMAGALATALS